jgi:hypothetical protein
MAMPTGAKSSKDIPVYTDNPENEIWDFITDFKSKQFVQNYIPRFLKLLLLKIALGIHSKPFS